MNETLMYFLAGSAGLGLGVVFYGGLWWTIRKGLSSPTPAWWFLGSFIVRMAVMVSGFLLVSNGHWQRLVACLLGFFVARIVVAWLTRPALTTQSATQQPTQQPNSPITRFKTTHASES